MSFLLRNAPEQAFTRRKVCGKFEENWKLIKMMIRGISRQIIFFYRSSDFNGISI